VEPGGFEPPTSSMPSRRAANCATAPPEGNCASFIAPWPYAVKLSGIRLLARRHPSVLPDYSSCWESHSWRSSLRDPAQIYLGVGFEALL
jgi:hypothetical protein